MGNLIFIIDDHSMMRNGLKTYLENSLKWKVFGSFSNSADCLEALEDCEKSGNLPSILIVDIQLKDENGFDLIKTVKERFNGIKVVIYSMYDNWGFVLQAKDLGVEGFVSKVDRDEDLLKCLEKVSSGGIFYEQKSEEIKSELESIMQILKKKEQMIFQLVLQGKTNDQIKNQLFISLHTVENYVSYLLNVTGCKNRREMVERYKR